MPISSMTVVRIIIFVGIATALSPKTHAATMLFDDQSYFISHTGASETTTIPTTTATFAPGDGFTSGNLTFSLVDVNTQFMISDATSHLPGNELSLDGVESFNIDINTGLVHYFGFDFVEPEFDPNLNGTFVESSFEVTLKNGATAVDSFSFSKANDSAQFVGVWTDNSFNRIEIRETTGDSENEFFGQFYTGAGAGAFPPPVVPLPAAAWMALPLLGGLGITQIIRRRRLTA